MKRVYTFLLAVITVISATGQIPERMSYQAVIRNVSGELVKSSPVGMKISILQGSTNGTVVYVETQTQTTNANGLLTLEIGGGTPVTGTFAGIDWSTGTYFIKTETDPTGGTNYTINGTSQILSVPYALLSEKTRSKQTLSINGSNLSISDGNTVSLNDYSFRSWQFPHGINHKIVTLNQPSNTDFIVPTGKTMYVLYGYTTSVVIEETTYGIITGNYLPNELSNPIFPSDTKLNFYGELTYFLADNDPQIEPVYFLVEGNTSTTYTVPQNKKLIVKSIGNSGGITIGSRGWIPSGSSTSYNLIIPPGTVIGSPQYKTIVTGYLIND